MAEETTAGGKLPPPPERLVRQEDAFAVERSDATPSLAETYWVNTKLYPPRVALAPDTDPVARANAEALAEGTAAMEARVVAGGKVYLTFPTVSLHKPRLPESASFVYAMHGRRTVRNFNLSAAVDLQTISSVLGYSYGWNPSRRRDYGGFKYAPSAGGLYPLEFYVVSMKVTGLKPHALYHYRPRGHLLEHLTSFGNRKISSLFVASPWIDDTGAVIFITGILPRLAWKYGERALRYLLLDAGHAAQNACLVAAALDIGICPVVGFFDDPVHDFLDVDGINEVVVYALIVGSPKGGCGNSGAGFEEENR